MDHRTRFTLLLVALVFCTIALAPRLSAARLPGNNQGYSPAQPIKFSHRLHAGEMEIACLYCHSGAEKSRHAGIPPAQLCMNCHTYVTAPFASVRAEDKKAEAEGRKPEKIVSPELQKLFDSIESGRPIEWIQVHRLPDFVFLDHRRHVAAGLSCQRCHGTVETMERVRQESDLSMGWCVQCHRDSNRDGVDGHAVQASLDCAGCHY